MTDLTSAYETLTGKVEALKQLTCEVDSIEDMQKAADACHEKVLPLMEELRVTASDAEAKIPDAVLGYPTYDQLLFSL